MCTLPALPCPALCPFTKPSCSPAQACACRPSWQACASAASSGHVNVWTTVDDRPRQARAAPTVPSQLPAVPVWLDWLSANPTVHSQAQACGCRPSWGRGGRARASAVWRGQGQQARETRAVRTAWLGRGAVLTCIIVHTARMSCQCVPSSHAAPALRPACHPLPQQSAGPAEAWPCTATLAWPLPSPPSCGRPSCCCPTCAPTCCRPRLPSGKTRRASEVGLGGAVAPGARKGGVAAVEVVG